VDRASPLRHPFLALVGLPSAIRPRTGDGDRGILTKGQTVSSGNDGGRWLRPLPLSGSESHRASGGIFKRGTCLVQPDVKLSQLVHRRPPGVTTHQWNSALRTRFDFVVCDARGYAPLFAVEFDDPAGRRADSERDERMKNAVCDAVGLELLRIESATLRPGSDGRRIVEYVIDARTFMESTLEREEASDLLPDGPLNYRDIIGRLPDGRSGFVNDLGALARVAAVDAYAGRQLTDPIIRGLHVCWKDGPAEGWAWVEVRDRRCIFERARLWQHRFSCGVDPGRLAEDLATAAIGQWLKTLGTAEPVLRDRADIKHAFEELRLRREEMENGFAFDHLCFG
jgi:hypothetical protein